MKLALVLLLVLSLVFASGCGGPAATDTAREPAYKWEADLDLSKKLTEHLWFNYGGDSQGKGATSWYPLIMAAGVYTDAEKNAFTVIIEMFTLAKIDDGTKHAAKMIGFIAESWAKDIEAKTGLGLVSVKIYGKPGGGDTRLLLPYYAW